MLDVAFLFWLMYELGNGSKVCILYGHKNVWYFDAFVWIKGVFSSFRCTLKDLISNNMKMPQ